jgi:hypothetical protein
VHGRITFFSLSETLFQEKKIVFSMLSQEMARTRALTERHVGRDLAGLVVTYAMSKRRNWFAVARCGEFESCAQSASVDECLHGACEGGHTLLARQMIASGATALNHGLNSACVYGHLALANLMIANGATDWNSALAVACGFANHALVTLMIAKGANDWDHALAAACKGGHLALADLMIAKGAIVWNVGLRAACKHGHVLLAKRMLEKGATKCDHCGRREH